MTFHYIATSFIVSVKKRKTIKILTWYPTIVLTDLNDAYRFLVESNDAVIIVWYFLPVQHEFGYILQIFQVGSDPITEPLYLFGFVICKKTIRVCVPQSICIVHVLLCYLYNIFQILTLLEDDMRGCV